MKRSLQSGGGFEHITLVKLASMKTVDEFQDLRSLLISYEETAFQMEIKMSDDTRGYGSGYTNAHFNFRPDIIIRAASPDKLVIPRARPKDGHLAESPYGPKPWENIFDSSTIVVEAETDPSNIFGNVLKMEAYKKIKGDEIIGRRAYAFVLACWDDAKLPESIEPFDEVWKFPKKSSE